MRLLVSAGEASGDLYASGVARVLADLFPGAQMYGCAGPRLQAAGVAPIVDAASLSVVGLAEVVTHLPRIYGQYRKLLRYVRAHPPDFAVLTDNPDFHLRLARHLHRMGVPVYYLVAPQVWAWRQGRVKTIRRLIDRLFCLFPFEEPWFRQHGVDATYIGHPLASVVRARMDRGEFCALHGLDAGRRIVTLLPGSRTGEALRHLPDLLATVKQLQADPSFAFLLAMPAGFRATSAYQKFREPLASLSIQVVENDTWDAIAHADLALAASGTVTVEAAVLGTPVVTFYKVSPLTWWAGRRLVKVPFLSMVNLIAGSPVVPELIQREMTPATLVAAARRLLGDPAAASAMRSQLARVRDLLTREGDPFERAASLIEQDWTARRHSPSPPSPAESHPPRPPAQETIK